MRTHITVCLRSLSHILSSGSVSYTHLDVYKRQFLASGYYNEPEKTAAAFPQNPLNRSYPERVYRTGDLARMNDRREYIYICRKDFQIKRMGFRIEPGEIETAANAIAGIKSSAVIYDDKSQRILLIYEGSLKDTCLLYTSRCV